MNLVKKLPEIIRSDPFWIDFCRAVQDELLRLKEEKGSILKNYFDLETKNTLEDLRSYCKEFGLVVDLTLFSDSDLPSIVSYMKKEAEALPYTIRKRGTKDYFEYIFSRTSRVGYAYPMCNDAHPKRVSLYRALSYEGDFSIYRELVSLPMDKPLLDVYPDIPFADVIIESKTIDRGQLLDGSWVLDDWASAKSVRITNHVAFELMVDRVLPDDGLVDNTYLRYLLHSALAGRKLSQIPHIGVCLFGRAKNLLPPNLIPQTGCLTSVLKNLIGEESPTELFNKFSFEANGVSVYRDSISSNEVKRYDTLDLINLSIPANMVGPYTVASISSSAVLLYSGVLSRTRIAPNTVQLFFYDLNSERHLIVDDGKGRLYFKEKEVELLIEGYSGAIDYNTGALNVSLQTTNFTFNPKPGTIISAYYRTQSFVEYTGLKIISALDEEVVSVTFPKAKFESMQYHMSFLLALNK
jgi:hypothetical protein